MSKGLIIIWYEVLVAPLVIVWHEVFSGCALRELHCVYLSCAAAHCRGGYYFCLDTKGSKKSSQQKGFFAARGHFPANQAKPWLEKFAAILRALPYALQKFPMPCHALGHHRFA